MHGTGPVARGSAVSEIPKKTGNTWLNSAFERRVRSVKFSRYTGKKELLWTNSKLASVLLSPWNGHQTTDRETVFDLSHEIRGDVR